MKNKNKSFICIGAVHKDRTLIIKKNYYLKRTNPVLQKKSIGGVAYNIASKIAILNQNIELISLNCIDDIKKEIKKTKEFNKFIVKNKLNNSLIISDKPSKLNIIKSARNIPNLKIIEQEGTNVYDLLKYKNVIFTTTSIKIIQERLSK